MPLATVVNTLHTDTALLWLLTVREPNNNIVLRAAANLEAVVSRGNTYEAFPFEVKLAPDDGQRIQGIQVTFPNVGRELMEVIREYSPETPPGVLLELVLSDAPDTVEKQVDFLRVGSVDYDTLTATFNLIGDLTFGRKTSLPTYSQYEFPALFWSQR